MLWSSEKTIRSKGGHGSLTVSSLCVCLKLFKRNVIRNCILCFGPHASVGVKCIAKWHQD